MRRIGVILACVVLLAALARGPAGADCEALSVKHYRLSGDTVPNASAHGDSSTIVGSALNRSGDTLIVVEVRFALHGDTRHLGDRSDFTEGLGPESSWRFRVELFEEEPVSRVELRDVSCVRLKPWMLGGDTRARN